jgi:putative ABC transport system substrate-binding protein
MRVATVVAVAVLALAAPYAPAVTPQPASTVHRIGVLGERSADDPMLVAFRQGLYDLGYIEGQNIVIEGRYAQGSTDRIPLLAQELVQLNVDVLSSNSSST